MDGKMNKQILTLTIVSAMVLSACVNRSVRAQKPVTPEIQHLVMRGQTLKTPGGNIVRLMLLGLNTTKEYTDLFIAWHLLKVRSREIRFAFKGFTLMIGNRSYSSIQNPESFTPKLNRAGSIRIRFGVIPDIVTAKKFHLVEDGAPAGTSWSFPDCTIARGGKK